MEYTDSMNLDYSDWAAPVENLGPGRRLILWVRGCPLACAGCMTPELWDAAPARSHRAVEDLAAQLAPLLAGLDGLSLSGGEPTLQAAPLTQLVRLLRARPELEHLEVLSYSGFTLEELSARGADVSAYLAQLDILIDGRFERSAANDLAWRGSDNQRVHLLSPRAQERYGDLIEAPDARTASAGRAGLGRRARSFDRHSQTRRFGGLPRIDGPGGPKGAGGYAGAIVNWSYGSGTNVLFQSGFCALAAPTGRGRSSRSGAAKPNSPFKT